MDKLPVKVHPAANLFPMMSGKAFDELVEDIRENGQQEPVTFYCGKVLDGRNRLKACEILDIEPEAVELDEAIVTDPVAWVLSMNLHRRHLSETQREAIAAKVANLKHGDVKSQRDEGPNGPSSIDDAACQLNVNPRSVKRAKAALKGGCKKLCEMLEAGEIKSSTAANFVKAVPDKKEQAEILKQGLAAVRDATRTAANEEPAATTVSYQPEESLPSETQPLVATRKPDCELSRIRQQVSKLSTEQLIALREFVVMLIEKK